MPYPYTARKVAADCSGHTGAQAQSSAASADSPRRAARNTPHSRRPGPALLFGNRQVAGRQRGRQQRVRGVRRGRAAAGPVRNLLQLDAERLAPPPAWTLEVLRRGFQRTTGEERILHGLCPPCIPHAVEYFRHRLAAALSTGGNELHLALPQHRRQLCDIAEQVARPQLVDPIRPNS